MYDEQPIAGRDIQYPAPDSQSRYTTSFDNICHGKVPLVVKGMLDFMEDLSKDVAQAK